MGIMLRSLQIWVNSWKLEEHSMSKAFLVYQAEGSKSSIFGVC